jgi:hypothetical protein
MPGPLLYPTFLGLGWGYELGFSFTNFIKGVAGGTVDFNKTDGGPTVMRLVKTTDWTTAQAASNGLPIVILETNQGSSGGRLFCWVEFAPSDYVRVVGNTLYNANYFAISIPTSADYWWSFTHYRQRSVSITNYVVWWLPGDPTINISDTGLFTAVASAGWNPKKVGVDTPALPVIAPGMVPAQTQTPAPPVFPYSVPGTQGGPPIVIEFEGGSVPNMNYRLDTPASFELFSVPTGPPVKVPIGPPGGGAALSPLVSSPGRGGILVPPFVSANFGKVGSPVVPAVVPAPKSATSTKTFKQLGITPKPIRRYTPWGEAIY